MAACSCSPTGRCFAQVRGVRWPWRSCRRSKARWPVTVWRTCCGLVRTAQRHGATCAAICFVCASWAFRWTTADATRSRCHPWRLPGLGPRSARRTGCPTSRTRAAPNSTSGSRCSGRACTPAQAWRRRGSARGTRGHEAPPGGEVVGPGVAGRDHGGRALQRGQLVGRDADARTEGVAVAMQVAHRGGDARQAASQAKRPRDRRQQEWQRRGLSVSAPPPDRPQAPAAHRTPIDARGATAAGSGEPPCRPWRPSPGARSEASGCTLR